MEDSLPTPSPSMCTAFFLSPKTRTGALAGYFDKCFKPQSAGKFDSFAFQTPNLYLKEECLGQRPDMKSSELNSQCTLNLMGTLFSSSEKYLWAKPVLKTLWTAKWDLVNAHFPCKTGLVKLPFFLKLAVSWRNYMYFNKNHSAEEHSSDSSMCF